MSDDYYQEKGYETFKGDGNDLIVDESLGAFEDLLNLEGSPFEEKPLNMPKKAVHIPFRFVIVLIILILALVGIAVLFNHIPAERRTGEMQSTMVPSSAIVISTITPTITETPSVTETETVTTSPTSTVCHNTVTVVSVQNANIRNGPGKKFSIVGSAKSGVVLDFLGRNEDNTWTNIGEDEWISTELLSTPACN